MARRELQEINAGSMADIAFLLLIFFLVTTTMDQDKGILRMLPPIVEDQEDLDIKLKERNVYVVLVNANDDLLVENDLMDIGDLKEGTMKFLTNMGVFQVEDEDLSLTTRTWVNETTIRQNLARSEKQLGEDPENVDAKKEVDKFDSQLNAIDFFGRYREISEKGVVSLQNDNGTSYDMYLQVQNELTSATNQLRDDLLAGKMPGSKGINYKKSYLELDDSIELEKQLIKAVRQVIPQRISEAEPKATPEQAAN